MHQRHRLAFINFYPDLKSIFQNLITHIFSLLTLILYN